MRPLRLLMVSASMIHGGMEAFAARTALEMQERGHHVVFACRDGSWIQNHLTGSPVSPLPIAPRSSGDPVSIMRMASLMRRGRIDAAHAHKGKDYVPTLLAARLAGSAVVLSRHDTFTMSDLSARAAARANRVLPVSNAVRAVLVDRLGVPPRRAVTLYPGIDPDRFPIASGERRNLQRYGIPSGAPVIGVVNQLFEGKRLDTLVKATAILAKSLPNITCVIVGRGSEQPKIEALASSLGISDRIILTGFVEDAMALSREFDIFVSAAQGEAFCYAILEAMASGLPVISARSGGPTELIEEGVTGMFFPVGDESALAEVAEALLHDPDRRRQMGQAGRLRAAALFHKTQMLDKLEAIYRDVSPR